MLSELGLTVAREIPGHLAVGLLNGSLTAHGGVVRNGLGQIVAHLAQPAGAASLASLIPGAAALTTAVGPAAAMALPAMAAVGSVVNVGQMYMLSRDVQVLQQTVDKVLSLSMATTALSGLGLVTSIAGFAYLSQRLSKIDAKLNALQKQVAKIRALIQSQQRAQLLAAIDYLRQAETAQDERVRHDLLMQAKSTFTMLTHYYRDLWADAESIGEVEGVDEYFALSFMGAALATNELGMREAAHEELMRNYEAWRTLARRHCGRLMLGDDPQRLLDASLVNELPTRELVATLDFVNGTNKGIDWLDDLRTQATSVGSKAFSALPGRVQRMFPSKEEKPAIELASRLRARDVVLNADSAHFGFLAEKKLSASGFASAVNRALVEQGNVPVCITGVPQATA
ncbi:hypothetical protein M6I34_08150 [Burkholderiaceae bacterium FT117]|uniref:hypothetical protein n=1 Tax=Zeimonas sediminis TaxID=2944268 RepID=UPI0023431716|nr:hypothetical protein [Zeimonas sediminis]MCM5570477.1 hypothetical protein [Zeimonas sediminis]